MISTSFFRSGAIATIVILAGAGAACSPSTEVGEGSITILDVDAPPPTTSQVEPTALPVSTVAPEPTSAVAPPSAPEPANEPTRTDASPCGVGADPDAVDAVPVDWQVGTGVYLEIVKTTSQSPGVVTTTAATVEVVEDFGTGYVLVWTNGRSEFDGVNAIERRSLAPIARLAEGLQIEYEVSSEGFFVALRNEAELVDNMLESVDAIAELMGDDAAEQAQIRTMVEGLIATPGFVETTAIEEVQIWHSLHGVLLNLGEELVFDDLLPNALGGEPFPAIATISLAEERTDTDCGIFSYITEPDAEAFFDILFDSLGQFAGDGEPLDLSDDERDALMRSEVVNTISVVFDEGTGWPVEASAEQFIQIGDESRVEDTRIVALGPIEG